MKTLDAKKGLEPQKRTSLSKINQSGIWGKIEMDFHRTFENRRNQIHYQGRICDFLNGGRQKLCHCRFFLLVSRALPEHYKDPILQKLVAGEFLHI